LLTSQKNKKKQNFASLFRSRFCADRAQNLQGQRPTDNVLRLLQISLNQFTSGGVIAERVNTIKTRHKLNPILGEAIASRRVTNDEHDNAWLLENGDCWLVKKTNKGRIHTETNKMQANITASRLF